MKLSEHIRSIQATDGESENILDDIADDVAELESKLERASKFANANAEDVESLQGKVRELESLCSSQALRLQEALDARNERSAQFVAACQENLMLSSRLDSGRRIAQHWADQHSACAIEILSTLVERQTTYDDATIKARDRTP